LADLEITRRKKNWIGHILRGKDLLRDVMDGKRTSGRRRVGVIDDLREGNSYETLRRKAQDRAQRAGWRCWSQELA